jgi:hypothetical protein
MLEFSQGLIGDILTDISVKAHTIYGVTLQGSIFSLFYLRESNILIEHQTKKLSQLEQKLQQGRDVSFVLSIHLKDLVTHDDSGDDQALDLQEQLAEGCWLAECFSASSTQVR